jgi:hypothetical protein
VGTFNAFVLKLDGVGGEDQQADCQSADDFHYNIITSTN